MDKTNLRIALIILGLAVALALVGGVILTLEDKAIPEFLVAAGSGAIGAIAGVLTQKAPTDA